MKAPDHRYRAVQAALTTGAVLADPRSAALQALIDTEQCEMPDVEYAYDLFLQEDHRPIIEAFLLTRCPLNKVQDLLEISAQVLETYSHLFLDMSVFRNRLEIISFAGRYEGTPYGKEIVRTAVNVGVEYLYWTYGSGGSDLEPKQVIFRTMIDSFFRGLAHKGNALTTNTTKEAHKWWATAVKNAELSERLNPSTQKQAVDELRIALAQKDETNTGETFEVPLNEILH